MKVLFYCDNGANCQSERSEVLDTETDLGCRPGEWEIMSEEEKQEMVSGWAWDRLEIGFEELF